MTNRRIPTGSTEFEAPNFWKSYNRKTRIGRNMIQNGSSATGWAYEMLCPRPVHAPGCGVQHQHPAVLFSQKIRKGVRPWVFLRESPF